MLNKGSEKRSRPRDSRPGGHSGDKNGRELVRASVASVQAVADGRQMVMVAQTRDINAIEKSAINEAQKMGEDFYFGWDVQTREGTKLVDGVTYQGQMMLMRHWGNCACVPTLDDETSDYYDFRATFYDLEAGTTTFRLYRKHKSDAPGRLGQSNDGRQRWLDMQFSDGQSRAIRNAICAALPTWLQERCKKAAFAEVAKKIDPKQERQSIQERAQRLGVTGKHILAKFGRHIDDFNGQDLVRLRAMLRIVEEGDAHASDLFGNGEPSQKEMPPPDPKAELYARYVERLRAAVSVGDADKVLEWIKKKGAGKLTDKQMKDLVDLHRETVEMLADKPSNRGAASADEPAASDGERQPGDDSEEEKKS